MEPNTKAEAERNKEKQGINISMGPMAYEMGYGEAMQVGLQYYNKLGRREGTGKMRMWA